jgi:hypothetical protein
MAQGSYWELVEPYWNAVDIYGDEKTFTTTFALVPEVSAHLLAAHWCQSEVRNGGFYQFFDNPTGVLAPEAVAGFKAIGRADLGEIAAQAMASFGNAYPRDNARRCAILAAMKQPALKYWQVFEALDNAFYDRLKVEGFTRSADAYAAVANGRSQA